MLKSDFFLQFFFIAITAAMISLTALKFYPSGFLSPAKVSASTIISPLPKPTLAPQIKPPASIRISSLNLSLPVEPGFIENNQWTLFDDKVSWLATSSIAGEGNVILYAHNRVNLFGDLKKIEVGESIIIEQSGEKYSYKVTEKRKVTPLDIDAVLSTEDQLTLYTCDGTFDERRLIVIAKPDY